MGEWAPKGWLFHSSVDARMGAIKLAMAAWYLGLVVSISSIFGLLILYS